jgi:hypothetical protein
MNKKIVFIAFFLLMACEDKLAWIKTPVVYSINPETGTAGTMVTITGANFNAAPPANSVTIHGTSATIVEASSTVLKFVAPEETTGPIVVMANGQVAQNQPVFTYE